jgi:hypothetical protein
MRRNKSWAKSILLLAVSVILFYLISIITWKISRRPPYSLPYWHLAVRSVASAYIHLCVHTVLYFCHIRTFRWGGRLQSPMIRLTGVWKRPRSQCSTASMETSCSKYRRKPSFRDKSTLQPLKLHLQVWFYGYLQHRGKPTCVPDPERHVVQTTGHFQSLSVACVHLKRTLDSDKTALVTLFWRSALPRLEEWGRAAFDLLLMNRAYFRLLRVVCVTTLPSTCTLLFLLSTVDAVLFYWSYLMLLQLYIQGSFQFL